MIEHNFEYQECSKCHNRAYCIEWTYTHKRTTSTAFYCQMCFGWLPIAAQTKDQVLSDCDLLDIEEPIHNIRDLD